jgi:hypothetical protein
MQHRKEHWVQQGVSSGAGCLGLLCLECCVGQHQRCAAAARQRCLQMTQAIVSLLCMRVYMPICRPHKLAATQAELWRPAATQAVLWRPAATQAVLWRPAATQAVLWRPAATQAVLWRPAATQAVQHYGAPAATQAVQHYGALQPHRQYSTRAPCSHTGSTAHRRPAGPVLPT